uniref:Uncharacterized protein n=1 Tax=Oryza brachyantha TaxID=4533 RepID=J3ME81_ORYBR
MSLATPCSKRIPSPCNTALNEQMCLQEKEVISIDDDDTLQPPRAEVRLTWLHEEHIRLVSAWLQNSIDPIDGNDKKLEQYWGDVTVAYNSTTESNRKRNHNQLKLRWERIKKPVTDFNGSWVRTTKVYQSGRSDDQIMDQALELYASEHDGKAFTMHHIWRVLRHEKKWSAYVKKQTNEKGKSATVNNPVHAVNVEDIAGQRPIGQKKAKDEHKGKRKASLPLSEMNEKRDKFVEASTMVRKEREKMSEVQQNLGNKKVEAARLTHKAAQEHTKCKMLDTYKELFLAPTSHLSEEALVERSKTMESLRLSDLMPRESIADDGSGVNLEIRRRPAVEILCGILRLEFNTRGW